MRISIYTFVKDGLYYDFHVEAMLKHHLPLADEIIVNEGFSGDGTYEAIKSIDPKVHVHRLEWDQSDPNSWHRKFKNQARELCSGDWCILLDCDEFIPEWEFDHIRTFLSTTSDDLAAVRYTHFYGNYRVYMAKHSAITPSLGTRIHRNIPEVEVWGDGANVRVRGREYHHPRSPEAAFEVHHFGCVRRPARLRQKWRTQAKQHNEKNPKWDWMPGIVFDMMPHSWGDTDFLGDLSIYDGPYIKAVRDDPEEFVRDNFWLYNYLLAKSHHSPA